MYHMYVFGLWPLQYTVQFTYPNMVSELGFLLSLLFPIHCTNRSHYRRAAHVCLAHTCEIASGRRPKTCASPAGELLKSTSPGFARAGQLQFRRPSSR
jgi:hypothetical protein